LNVGYIAMNGASLLEIAEIAEALGHKTLAMVKRYAHLSEGHTAVVVARMNRVLPVAALDLVHVIRYPRRPQRIQTYGFCG